MNKTVIFVTFAALAAIGILGSLLLFLFRPDATATFTNLLVLVLGLVVSAAGTFAVLGKVNEKIDVVQKQTNGQLSAKEDEIKRLQAELTKYHKAAEPSNFDETTGATIAPVEEQS